MPLTHAHRHQMISRLDLPEKNCSKQTTSPSLSHSADLKDVLEAMRSLYDVAHELDLKTIAIPRTSIDQIPWQQIQE